MGGLQQQRPAAGPRQQRLQKKPIQTVKRFSPSKHYLATTLQTSQMATGIINKIMRSFWGFKSSKAPICLSEELLPDLFGFSCEYLKWVSYEGQLATGVGVVFKFFRVEIASRSPWGSKPNLGLLVGQFFSIQPLHRLSIAFVFVSLYVAFRAWAMWEVEWYNMSPDGLWRTSFL